MTEMMAEGMAERMVEEQEDRFSSNSIVGQKQEQLNLQMVKLLSANKAEEYVSLLYAIVI
jgi:hypothetical protein